MHSRRFNALSLRLEMEVETPLLVKSGLTSLDPSLPDMQFVRTRTAEGETVYVPGSSLKGAFRSFVEKVLRTMGDGMACQPFPAKDGAMPSCSSSSELKKAVGLEVYFKSCFACKMFGNTSLRGRFVFSDALPEGDPVLETRFGVAIDRRKGSVVSGRSGSLFEMEVMTSGKFSLALSAENFEIWQVGLMALALEMANEGFLTFGFGKSKGFGRVRMKPLEMTLEVAKRGDAPDSGARLVGLSAFLESEWAKRGLKPEVSVDLPRDAGPGAIDVEDGLLYNRYRLRDGALSKLLQDLKRKSLDSLRKQSGFNPGPRR